MPPLPTTQGTPRLPPLTTRIVTPRMVLRPPRPTDVAELRRHLRRSAEHLRPWSPAVSGPEDPTSLTSLSKVILRHRAEWKRGQSFALYLTTAGERVVGRVTLGHLVRGVFQNAYLGYEVDAEWVGQGLATEAVGATLDFAFGLLGLHRVQAAILPRNIRSLRVVAKLGFRREGLARDYLRIAGQWEDHELYALVSDEWHSRRGVATP